MRYLFWAVAACLTGLVSVVPATAGDRDWYKENWKQQIDPGETAPGIEFGNIGKGAFHSDGPPAFAVERVDTGPLGKWNERHRRS